MFPSDGTLRGKPSARGIHRYSEYILSGRFFPSDYHQKPEIHSLIFSVITLIIINLSFESNCFAIPHSSKRLPARTIKRARDSPGPGSVLDCICLLFTPWRTRAQEIPLKGVLVLTQKKKKNTKMAPSLFNHLPRYRPFSLHSLFFLVFQYCIRFTVRFITVFPFDEADGQRRAGSGERSGGARYTLHK